MWFVVGLLIMLSPEFAVLLQVKGTVTAGSAIMYCYIGLAVGDIVFGFLSQILKTRKKIIFFALICAAILIYVYLNSFNISSDEFYLLCLVMGFFIGYWAVFVTIAAEQFGTNLRSTVTTTVPNFVRGSVVILTLSFQALKGSFGLDGAAYIIGFTTIALALISLFFMEETFDKDLDYLEEN